MPPGPKPMPARKAVKLWLQSLGKGVASREMNRAPRLAAQVTSRELSSFYCRSAVLWFSGSLRQPRLVWTAMTKSSLTSLIFCFGTFLLREPQLWLGCLLGELRSKGRPHCAVCFCSGFAGWLLAVPLKVHSPHFGSCHSGRRKQSCVDRPQTTSLSQALATNLRTQRIWYCGCSIAGTLF